MKRGLRIAVAAVMTILVYQSLQAIPAFARKYDMSCNTCHAPVPKLKPFGEEFMNNGYQLPGQEPPRYYKETGDTKLMLMRELPLAIRVDGFLALEHENGVQTDLQTPLIAKLLSGGVIAKDVSYYLYFLMSEEGEVVGPEDAFLVFRNLLGTGVDATVGQFQVSDPLFKRELRLTREDYRIYTTAIGNSSASLTYDRGLMLGYSLPTKTDIIVGILNGNGIGKAGPAGFLDNDRNKNFLARVSQDVHESFRFGLFGYYGKEDQANAANTTTMLGPDVTLTFGPMQVNAQYLRREDDNPFFAPAGTTVVTEGAFSEVIVSPDGDNSEWYAVALFNWVSSDISSLKYQACSVSGHYMLARNVRLVCEYIYDIERKANKLSAGFVCAF